MPRRRTPGSTNRLVLLLMERPPKGKMRPESESLRTLRARKLDQGSNVMVIGCLQSVDITTSKIASIPELRASPGKSFFPEVHHYDIPHKSSVPAIAVRKRVNLHQSMMETQGDFVWRVGLVFHPCFGVFE
jgi:hypothetical protein